MRSPDSIRGIQVLFLHFKSRLLFPSAQSAAVVQLITQYLDEVKAKRASLEVSCTARGAGRSLRCSHILTFPHGRNHGPERLSILNSALLG